MLKRFACFVYAVFIAFVAHADTITINWKNTDGTTASTTTCESGGDVILPQTTPTAPSGYHFAGWKTELTKIEYLQKTGPAYIDTGFTANQDTRIVVDQQTISCSGGGADILGSRISYVKDAFAMGGCYNGNANFFVNYNTQVNNNNTSNDFSRHVLDLNRNKFYLDGVQKNSFKYNSFSTPGNIWIFGWSPDNTSELNNIRIFSVKIYNNDVIVRDMIPVLDSNGVPCMYDKVTHQFFYNSGTGSFIAGPVLTE